MGQGHSAEVFATRFDPSGQNIASGSMDRSISVALIVLFRGCDDRRTKIAGSAVANLRSVR